LKWITKDTVGTYKNHALVLVHYGWGTWKDIVDLSKHIQEKVYTIFSISIDPEVNFI
jgi:UDP-N-acetylmuramate dehydrogenase